MRRASGACTCPRFRWPASKRTRAAPTPPRSGSKATRASVPSARMRPSGSQRRDGAQEEARQQAGAEEDQRQHPDRRQDDLASAGSRSGAMMAIYASESDLAAYGVTNFPVDVEELLRRAE